MKRSRRFLAVVVVVALGLCVALYRAVRVSAEPAAEAAAAAAARPPAAAPAAESAQMSELRQEMFRLRHQVAAQEMRLGADPASAKVAPDTSPEARAEAERKRKDYVAGIEAGFRKEARDPQWSAATSSTIQAALAADEQLRPNARSVDCRAQTCRVEITDDGSGKLGKSLPMFVHTVGPALPTMTADHVADPSGGGSTMVLYLSRNTTFPASP